MTLLLEATALATQPSGDEAPMLRGPIDVSLAAGDFAVLSGPSGGGKSTLLRCLAMLESRAVGRILFLDADVAPGRVPWFRSQVGFLPQQPAALPLTVVESFRHPFTFACRRDRFDASRARSLLADLGLLEDVFERPVSELSGGERQRVALVRALLLDPTVLLLDEPMSALDEDSRLAMGDVLRSWLTADGTQRAALMSSHHADEVSELTTRRLVLDGTLLESE